MSGTTERAILVSSEQTKLIANALDRASTVIGAGTLLPLWQVHKGDLTPWPYAASAYIFVFSALLLHMGARRVLRGLR
jgi:hypothetical protein